MLSLYYLNYILLVGALSVTIPIAVFAIECFAALMPKPESKNIVSSNRPRTAVLIPAHNEGEQIALVIREAKKQLLQGDRLIVIADNCDDNTAEISRSEGVEVIEKVKTVEKGKGYALDCGLRHLEETDPPEVVVFLDGDCLVKKNAIANITRLAYKTRRPVQATYLMEQSEKPSLKDNVSTFALRVKNSVRFLGLNRLGGHCLLTGSGMAFPWSVINQVSLIGSINADDMKLTVDLTLKNSVPTYCKSALVIGRLMRGKDAQSQRTRWEHGHLKMIADEVPRLIKAFLKQPHFSLLLLALDISIPPLSLLVIIWVIAIAISTLSALLLKLSLLPAAILGIGGLIFFLSVISVWYKFGKEDLKLKELSEIPGYIVSKIPIYLKFIVRPQTGWLKTERDL